MLSAHVEVLPDGKGDGMVKLSDYGIAPPSQFGVKPANDVKFHLEFVARKNSNDTLARRGQ